MQIDIVIMQISSARPSKRDESWRRVCLKLVSAEAGPLTTPFSGRLRHVSNGRVIISRRHKDASQDHDSYHHHAHWVVSDFPGHLPVSVCGRSWHVLVVKHGPV